MLREKFRKKGNESGVEVGVVPPYFAVIINC